MRFRRPATFLLLTLTLLPGAATTAGAPSEGAIPLRLDQLEIVNRTANQAGEEIHLDAAEGAGLAMVKGLEMNAGCLALEVKGANTPGRSFVGIAFRAADANVYDAVYLRPFHFRAENPELRARALQYISVPAFDWPVLRQRHPGVYEKSIGTRPDPDGWVSLKVKFGDGRVKVFVDGAAEPQLDVALLTEQSVAGRVALWVGNYSSGAFRALHRCE